MDLNKLAIADDTAAFTRAIGAVLRATRQKRGWTLASAGSRVGISESVLCRAETGERSMDVARLVTLCAALGVDPITLVWQAQRDAFPFGWPYGTTTRGWRP
jgi:transcriptional regulator with XRE-family HTH domain